MPHRRSLLSAAATLLLGGCIADAPASTATDSPDSTSTASPTTDGRTDRPDGTGSPETPECTRGFTVELRPFAPTEQVVFPLRPPLRRLFERVVAEDGVALETYGEAPIPDEMHVAHEGAYYRVDYEAGGTEKVDARRADVSWEKGQEAPDDAGVVAYGDLPAVDRRALDVVIRGPEYSRKGLPTEGFGANDAPAPYPDGVADSVLVGAGTTWVRWNDRVWKVAVADEATTLTRRTFEYRAPRVADAEASFRSYIAERYLATLSDLSDAERRVLDAAKNGRHEDCNSQSAGYSALKTRLQDAPQVPGPWGNRWYVAYDGERYLLELASWVH